MRKVKLLPFNKIKGSYSRINCFPNQDLSVFVIMFFYLVFQLVLQLLDSLPTLFSKNPNVHSATGAAMQAALKLIVSSRILLLHIGNCKYSGNLINKPLYNKVLGIKNDIYS